MAYENIKKQAVEYLKDMHSLPVGSPTRKNLKKKFSDFLGEVKKKHGQEMVDKIMGNQSKDRVELAKTKTIIRCPVCNVELQEKSLERHTRRNHNLTK